MTITLREHILGWLIWWFLPKKNPDFEFWWIENQDSTLGPDTLFTDVRWNTYRVSDIIGRQFMYGAKKNSFRVEGIDYVTQTVTVRIHSWRDWYVPTSQLFPLNIVVMKLIECPYFGVNYSVFSDKDSDIVRELISRFSRHTSRTL